MRDLHKMKEKYEVSLDSSHIVSLTIVGLVVVAGVFMLGVMVGKRLSANEKTAQAPDLLTALDQRTAALDAVQKDASLTFQEELTKKTPSPTVVAEPVRVVEKAEPKPPEPKPAPEAKPLEKPEPKPVVAEAKPAEKPAPEPKPAEPKPAEKVAEVKPAEEPKPVEVAKLSDEKLEKPAPAPVPTRTMDAGASSALKDAFSRAQKPTETTPDGQWTLQLSAYQDRAEADRFAAGLRDKGYAPYIVSANVPGRGMWYRVRMGRFGTRDAATRYLSDFKRETQLDAIVTNN